MKMEQTTDQYPTMEHLIDMAYNDWSANPSWTKEDFWLHLDYPERVAVFIGNLNSQVENGGFMQWHDNGYSACGEDVVRLLTTVGGCDESLALVTKALKEIQHYEEDLFDDWGQIYEGVYDMLSDSLSQLDVAFYDVNTTMLTQVETYLATLMDDGEGGLL